MEAKNENSKNCIVFGDLTALNKEICLVMAKNHYNVAFNYSSTTQDSVEALVAQMKEYGVEVLPFLAPTDDMDSVNQMMESTKSTWKDISILINSCNEASDDAFQNMKEDQFRKLIDYNLTSVYRSTKSILKAMIFSRSGKILNISDSNSLKASEHSNCVYAAVKSGLVGFTRSLAKEVGRYGITVNTILLQNESADVSVQAENIYHTTLFSKDLTGQIIGLDSGYTDYLF